MELGLDSGTAIAAHLAPQPTIRVLGVDYLHLRLGDGSDLYVTDYGRPFIRYLLPENHWADRAWLKAHSVRLRGTSSLYRITTKPVDGLAKDIVLKWNRMGQDIPGETEAADLAGAEFNSPFEEFSLLIELRDSARTAAGRIRTHKPLAIYVPRKYVEAERLGRKQYRIAAIQRKHTEVSLDPNRQYAVIYEWVKGIDGAEALEAGVLDEATVRRLVVRSQRELSGAGFRVRDGKPHHIIVRPSGAGQPATERDGRILYALVDFELLDRTPSRERAVKASRRRAYLVRQARRFEAMERFPPGLSAMRVLGVEYVYGQVESTGGRLWVVGRAPALFEYFLPERWRRTQRTKLSALHRTYHTVTKDGIHLVWRVSRVGTRPEADAAGGSADAAAAYGFNSPFEEISLSLELTAKGIETTYARGVYMTGPKEQVAREQVDGSRYDSHAPLRTPDGHPVLDPDHDFIVIWGYWNGPDELLAARDEQVYQAIDATAALAGGFLAQAEYAAVLAATKRRLAAVGVEDLNFKPSHLLLSLDRRGRLARGAGGMPMVRICNFELLRRHTQAKPAPSAPGGSDGCRE